MLSTNALGGLTADVISAISSFREGQRRVTGWETAIRRGRLSGHFLGAYAEGGTYDFQLKKEKGYRGKYYAAAGITYGYVRPLARHLAIEFSVGIGYLDTEYRKYTSYGNDLVWVSSGKYHFIGPTKAKISLVWLLTSGR